METHNAVTVQADTTRVIVRTRRAVVHSCVWRDQAVLVVRLVANTRQLARVACLDTFQHY